MARLAASQDRVMASWQLYAAGVGRRAIQERPASGLLVALHRGVYCLGRPTRRSLLRAALVAVGEPAFLSHDSSAWIHGLQEKHPSKVHVTVPRHVRKRDGIAVHCVTSLGADEVTSCAGFPCTAVTRTLVDLAATHPRRTVERALDQAELRDLWNEFEPRRTRPGSGRLNAILAVHTPGSTIARNTLEEAFLALCRGLDIPQPLMNQRLLLPGGQTIYPDAFRPEHRVVVELDGRAAHLRRKTFESDRARDVELSVAGYRPNRFTWLQITRRRDWVAAQMRALLSLRPPPGGS